MNINKRATVTTTLTFIALFTIPAVSNAHHKHAKPIKKHGVERIWYHTPTQNHHHHRHHHARYCPPPRHRHYRPRVTVGIHNDHFGFIYRK